MSLLDVEDLTARYGSIQVLHGVSLSVQEGDLSVVLGPAGHGKSTLLKTICGLVSVESGSVRFQGEAISGMSARDIVARGIVYVPERRHLFSEMTVEENLALGATTKEARRVQRDSLDYVYHLFPALLQFSKKTAGTLSGGQARMLAVGRGLMSGARVLAVDEPSQGLSPKLTQEVFERIAQIRERGTTILLVEQNCTHVLPLASTVYLIEDGRIAFSGTRDEALRSDLVRQGYLGGAARDLMQRNVGTEGSSLSH